MNLKTNYLFLGCCLFPLFLSSQIFKTYKPLAVLPENITSIFTSVDEKLVYDLSQIESNLSPSEKKKIKKIYKERANNVKFAVDEMHYLFGEETNDFFDKILAEIYATNPTIPKDEIHFFLSRYPWPNAMSLGEGTIVLNIGLLRRLENESQIAFILCHEIAHYTLNHSNKSIKKNITHFYNSKRKARFRKISQQKYKAGEKAKELYKTILYEKRKHQRENETEADEIGLKYLKNTKYDATQTEQVLIILDSIDQEKYKYDVDVSSVFNAAKYPFKKKWIAEEDLLSFNAEEVDVDLDSIKTHPDCIERIALLPNQLLDYVSPSDKNTSNKPFDELVVRSDFEMVESYLFFEDYGKAIYTALKLLHEYPNNAYLYAAIGQSFHLIHGNQSNHTLRDGIEMPNNYQPAQYQELLRFLHRMRLKEIAKVNYYFLEKVNEQHLDNEDFLYAWIMANKMMKYTDVANDLTFLYFEKFPDGYYLKSMKRKKKR